MGLTLTLLSRHSKHELFHRKSLRRCGGHRVRMRRIGHCSQHLKSPSHMMANEIIVHVPHVAFDEMSQNIAWRQENKLAKMVEQKGKHVGHFLPWPSRNTAQILNHR